MREVCVVHLIWAPLGIKPFRRFLDSYRQRPAGLEHRLLVVFNGFSPPVDCSQYQEMLAGIEHQSLVLPEPVQDLTAYLAAARETAADDVCFLNSYSVILHDDWLAKLGAALAAEGTGMVGATGSWETRCPSMSWPVPARSPWTPRGLRSYVGQALAIRRLGKIFQPFPNPHLRTNGFMIARERLLSLDLPSVLDKDDAHRFESGRQGLTARVLQAGLQPRVVDARGHAWPADEWRLSRTFRSGEQENLLIADNRTRDYQQASAQERLFLQTLAWGTPEPIEPKANGQQ